MGRSSEIVFGGSQPADQNDQSGAREPFPEYGAQIFCAVAHHGLEAYFYSQGVQPVSKKKRIGIEVERRQEFRTDGDDLSVHT